MYVCTVSINLVPSDVDEFLVIEVIEHFNDYRDECVAFSVIRLTPLPNLLYLCGRSESEELAREI